MLKSSVIKRFLGEYRNCISYDDVTGIVDPDQSFYNLAYMILDNMPEDQIKNIFGAGMGDRNIDEWIRFLQDEYPELIEEWQNLIDKIK